MSKEKEILDLLEARIATIPGAPIPSRHYYDLSKNDNVKNTFIFAVTPGGSSNVEGTTRSFTTEQNFALEVSSEYIEKESNDIQIRESVEKIESFVQSFTLSLATMPRVQSIFLIKPPEKSDPVINQNIKSVSRTYTFAITYRVHF